MPKLRIGLLADNWNNIEPWIHRLIAQIGSHEDLEIVALVNAINKQEHGSVHWLYHLVYAMERFVFGRSVPADPKSSLDLLSKCPPIEQANKDELNELALDVIVNVDGSDNGQDLAVLCAHGVWFLDMNREADGLAGYDAVIGKRPTALIALSRYKAKKAKSHSIAAAWVNPKFALSRNALFMKENAVVLIVRELNQLARTGTVEKRIDNESRNSQAPGFFHTIYYVWHLVCEIIRRGVLAMRRRTGFRADTYFLLKGKGDVLNFNPEAAMTIMPTGNNFWADPFLWERDGFYYCFYEHYNRATQLGHIGVGRFDEEKFTVLGDALKTDIHLSFPFLFEDEGELYMMPETSAAKRIEIWRCTDFPMKWELHSTGLEGTVPADSVILKDQGKWWLFTNLASNVYLDNCSELHVFEIDGPDLTNITPHKGNPVVFDSETARNAGRIHILNGKFYRPSQVNAYGQYGYGLNIMEIEELSLETYREKRIRRVDPDFRNSLSGCHHFDAVDGHFIMDSLLTAGTKDWD